MTNEELYDATVHQLITTANDLALTLGLSCVQISATTRQSTDQASIIFHAGAGSIYERMSVARDFVLREDEKTRLSIRRIYGRHDGETDV